MLYRTCTLSIRSSTILTKQKVWTSLKRNMDTVAFIVLEIPFNTFQTISLTPTIRKVVNIDCIHIEEVSTDQHEKITYAHSTPLRKYRSGPKLWLFILFKTLLADFATLLAFSLRICLPCVVISSLTFSYRCYYITSLSNLERRIKVVRLEFGSRKRSGWTESITDFTSIAFMTSKASQRNNTNILNMSTTRPKIEKRCEGLTMSETTFTVPTTAKLYLLTRLSPKRLCPFLLPKHICASHIFCLSHAQVLFCIFVSIICVLFTTSSPLASFFAFCTWSSVVGR